MPIGQGPESEVDQWPCGGCGALVPVTKTMLEWFEQTNRMARDRGWPWVTPPEVTSCAACARNRHPAPTPRDTLGARTTQPRPKRGGIK